MTRERAEELAIMFKDNYELAKKMGANNEKLTLVVALLYTLDDMNQLPYEAEHHCEFAPNCVLSHPPWAQMPNEAREGGTT